MASSPRSASTSTRAPRASIWGKSLVARYVPTNALMVVGRVVMAERHGVSKRGCLASIVYELGLAVVTAVMVGAYFVITLPQLDDQPARYAILVVVPLALIALASARLPAACGLRAAQARPAAPAGDASVRARPRAGASSTWSSWVAMGIGVVAFAAALHPLDAGDVAYAAAAYPVAFCAAVVTFVVPGRPRHARRRARALAGGRAPRRGGDGDRCRLPHLSNC